MSIVTDRATEAGRAWAETAAPADRARLERFAEHIGDDDQADSDRELALLAFEAIHPEWSGDRTAARDFWSRTLGNDSLDVPAVLDFITGAVPDWQA
jgi:hypothetical protein